MNKEPEEVFYRVITHEEPFSISGEGISFRGETALQINVDIGRENFFQIAESLNNAFQNGFNEGQEALRKAIQKFEETNREEIEEKTKETHNL